jgi:glycosyltransferase involved in cell wall biosynthesis
MMAMKPTNGRIKVCFVGGARYGQPLDMTSSKKFAALTTLGELFVIGFSQDLSPRRFTEQAHFYLLPRLPLPMLRYAEMFVLTPCLALWLIMRHRVHVLIAQSAYEAFAAAWAKKLAGWLGYKVALVVESHGDFEASLFLQRRIILPGLYRFLMGQAAGFALKHADVLRAVSYSTKDQLQWWNPGKPLVQFTTWTDIDVFLQAGLNHENHSSQDILYAGVLIPRKGVHHLINAFATIAKDFPQARLVVVGHEENKRYAADLKDQVRRYGLDGRVEFAEEMPQAELAVRMRKAHVFVLPTYSEGLPRVVLEGMAVGLPVVSSPVSGIPEIVNDGVTGWLVPPGDEITLADRLRWVLQHPEEAREMGCRGREFAEQFFSTARYVGHYHELFERANSINNGWQGDSL